MKYIIYCRKSTDTEDKQILSLDSQESELIRLADSQSLNVIATFKESMSAKAPGRPIFNQMMTMILSGEADAILCWKIDRLTRNPVDGGQIQWLLQNGSIKCITTFEKNYFPNDNVLIMSIEQAMANQYIRELSVNVKRGNRAKLERGEWPNHAPFGYINDKATKTIKIDKKKEQYVKRAYELYATGGYTLKEISEQLYSEGLRTDSGRKVFKSQIHRILTGKFYLSLMERDGILYKGNHTALVSQKLFDTVQDVFENRLHPRPKKHFYSARGFLSCASCGCAITADTKKGHQYYYCTNGKGICTEHKGYMRSDFIHGLISQLFLELQFDLELIEISGEAYKQRNASSDSYVDQTENTLLEELKSLDSKESTLTDGFISQIIKRPLYEQKMKEIENERVTLKSQLAEITQKGANGKPTFEQIKSVFIDGITASKRYTVVDDTERRKMLEKLLSNLSIKNKSVAQIKFKPMYQVLANAPKNASILEMLPDLDSNQDDRYQKPESYH